ncbi:CDC1p [Pseudohyphozyma bogoriensis]|nr:CDC1p [Pseudohyphozyma bogoriensis]
MAADPQLIDMRSYPGRNWVSRKLGVWFTDAYLRKSWRFVIKSEEEHGGGGVDAVVWLGDLLDSGVESVDRSEHSHYVHRFHLLFPLPRSPSPQGSHSSLSPPIPTIYLPGNHDLGLHLPSSSLASYARERFTAAFGEVMGEKEWNGWSVVWVDSMGLLEQGEEGKEAREWVEDVGARPNTLPRILLTHIPLYRPADTSCGPAREHAGGIHEGSGRNYQTELDTVTSEWLLRTLGPTLVYSGDDHDSCIITHPTPRGSPPSTPSTIIETTVKSLSMASGVRKPGYHLLSISSTGTYAQTACTLPDQNGIWLGVYVFAFLLLTSLIALPKLLTVFQSRLSSILPPSSSTTSSHAHRRSMSRKILLEDLGTEDDQDESYVFPTFPFGGCGEPAGEGDE